MLYLVPGFLARQIFRTRYPAKRLSQFEGVVWSIIHSLIILLGLTGIAWIFDSDKLDILRPSQNPLIQPATMLVLLIGGFVWGGILIGYHRLLPLIFFLPSPDPQAIWPVIATRAPKKELWMLVRTKQGILYLGWLEQYSFDPSTDDHEFVLCPAYLVDDDLNVKRDLKQGGVYLNTRDVESLEMIPVNKKA
ncbi:MAG: DUF6338 family protein [Nitrospira sp.]|nr:DUF6338 family protein [Nitrospira sp.]